MGRPRQGPGRDEPDHAAQGGSFLRISWHVRCISINLGFCLDDGVAKSNHYLKYKAPPHTRTHTTRAHRASSAARRRGRAASATWRRRCCCSGPVPRMGMGGSRTGACIYVRRGGWVVNGSGGTYICKHAPDLNQTRMGNAATLSYTHSGICWRGRRPGRFCRRRGAWRGSWGKTWSGGRSVDWQLVVGLWLGGLGAVRVQGYIARRESHTTFPLQQIHPQVESLLNGPYDQAGCRLQISAGVGGADAADWAGILLRMYQRSVVSV